MVALVAIGIEHELFPCLSSNSRSCAIFFANTSASACVSVSVMPANSIKHFSIFPIVAPSMRTSARLRRCTTTHMIISFSGAKLVKYFDICK